ncbi:hypothetical protein DMC30DRAFT_446425 [Rhodotorula diobovata]|uniref:Translation initiation factor eIF2B subunit gamma n=1 Tax=Rhodotorula diobovata TaxID=5288 RepID=A0A5C5FWT6_9BASI|nr:hypothetical protein DMC30DRAFT_446425 [Rhodotorula diobovata]
MSMLPNSLLPEQLPKAQFRAVVPCGYGVDLFPLVEPADQLSSDEEDARPAGIRSHGRGHGQCKALLPVAGKKMIDWVLERIEAAGIFDILVLAPDSIAKPIAHHLRSRRAALAGSGSYLHPLARIELEEIPEEVATKNVVRSLMWAAEKQLITTDFIVAPCDLLLSPANLHAPSISLAALLDRHRSDDNLLTTLFSERAAGNLVEARKNGPPEVLTIYDRKTSTLLDIREMDDFDEDEVPLRTSLLAKFPAPTLTTSLVPTQLYIFSSLVLPILTSPTHSRRLRNMEDLPALAGWISRLAWRNKGREQLGLSSTGGRPGAASSSCGGKGAREDGLALGRSTTQPPAGTGRKDVLGLETATGAPSGTGTGVNTPALVSRSSWRPDLGASSPLSAAGAASPSGGLFGASAASAAAEAANERWEAGFSGGAAGGPLAGKKSVAAQRAGKGGCKIVVWRVEDGFAARGNTVSGFVEINRAALRLLPPAPPPTGTPSGVFISPDSHLHPSVYPNLGEKVGIKRCIIGKNTTIGKGSKLTNCVIMESVVVGENVKLDGCVISNGVQVRDRAALKDCEIGRDVIVDFDTQTKGEQLVVEVD